MFWIFGENLHFTFHMTLKLSDNNKCSVSSNIHVKHYLKWVILSLSRTEASVSFKGLPRLKINAVIQTTVHVSFCFVYSPTFDAHKVQLEQLVRAKTTGTHNWDLTPWWIWIFKHQSTCKERALTFGSALFTITTTITNTESTLLQILHRSTCQSSAPFILYSWYLNST